MTDRLGTAARGPRKGYGTGLVRPAMVRLEPMSPEEFRTFLAWLDQDYADAHVRAGTWDRASALERAHAETQKLLPDGPATPDQFLNTIRESSTGARVGEIWHAIQREGTRPQLFVFWVGIDEKHRRRGYAGEALRMLEAEARRTGCYRVALHVFGDNTNARTLYTRLGYRETNVLMAKPVDA